MTYEHYLGATTLNVNSTDNAADLYRAQLIAGAQAKAQAANQPRELRVLERVEGLAGGIGELSARLEIFIARLSNAPPKGESNGEARPPQGLMDNIQTAEQRLRYCLELVAKLNDAF